MSLKIVSDGQPHTTRVIDTETGNRLKNITSIKIEGGMGAGLKATITTVDIELDIEVDNYEINPRDT